MKKKIKTKSNNTANEFINVADIKSKFLFTKDNNIISFVKLSPISISTMSKTDIKLLLKTLCSEFSGFDFNIRFFKISRPLDISNLIRSYKEMYQNSTNNKQKEMLRGATLFLHKYSTGRAELENQHYIILSSKNEQELEKNVSDVIRKFASAKISTEVLENEEIARLCNLFVNPSYTNEKMDIGLSYEVSIIEDFTKNDTEEVVSYE